MYVKRGSIFPKEESEAGKNQSKENRTSKKELSTLLMTEEKVQWWEVALRNQEKRKRPLERQGAIHHSIPRSQPHWKRE